MSATGLILQFAYCLRRHFWLAWPLSRWLGLLLVAVVVWALIRWRPFPWMALIPAGFYLAYLLMLTWAQRQGYLRFEPLTGEAGEGEHAALQTGSPPPLGIQEMAPARASGWFTVEGKDQYYVDIEADFETVGTREHIVLGRVHPSRFLLFGQWPTYEMGWWYIFFEPGMIQDMRLGRLHFGAQPHLALRVLYAPNGETKEAAYLTFDDAVVLRRVWDDLMQDAPPRVTN
ncbi:MAG: hypothetical protein PVG56_05135 [Anaerolineae bacterium]